MIKKTIYFFLLIIVLHAFFSCKNETIKPQDLGYKYFQMNIGHWTTYDVDSTIWDDFYSLSDSLHKRSYKYEIKELIESNFLDNENRNTQRIERYKKISDTSNWHMKDVWAANLTSSTAEKVEENIRFVKLIFPIDDKNTWNGNAFNTLAQEDYKYENIYKPFTVNNVTYDSTITVIQKIEPTQISETYKIEVYAKNIGMIYKQYREIEMKDYLGNIIKGADYTYKLINYGN